MKFKRGLEKDLPILSVGEPGYTTDTHKFFIGSSSGNIQIAKIDDLSDMQSAPVIPNSYGWVSTDGQDTFQIPTGKFYDARLMSVTVGGVPQPNITLIDNKTFQLPEILSSGVNVYVEWYEVAIPVTAGHHSTHEAGGADEIDITKLKNFDQIASVLQNASSVTPNSYSWISTDGQDTFQIDNGKFTDVRLMDVTVGGVIQTSISLINDTTFQLPETLSAGMEVYVEWFETSPSATIGHHTTHELNGNDEIDSRKLKNIQDFGTNVMVFGADSTGSVESTSAFQNALNNGGKVFIPSGTYLVGGLQIPSNTSLIGLGKVTLKYNNTGYASPFGKAVLVNTNLPTYYASGDVNRQQVSNVVNNIQIKNITFELQNNYVNGIQLIGVDYALVEDVVIQNGNESSGDGGAGLDLRAVRYSTFRNVRCNNVNGDDVISVTDANFKPLNYNGVHNGISRDLLFENCRVENSTNDGAFELDDGMYNVTFLNCIAENNTGQAYDLHLHTNEYDLQNISFINCKAINNKSATNSVTDQQKVAGFILGQCPSGSRFKNITLENCVSIGSPMAIYCASGSQTGYKENISIIGGYFENAWVTDGTINSYNSVIYLGKQFRSLKVLGANISGVTDSYGFYSYATADGLKISNISINGTYIPLGLTHTGGRLELVNITANVSTPSSALSTVCIAVEADDAVINGIIMNLDVSKYSSSVLRIISEKKISISGVIIENTGVLGGNCIQFDTVGMATLTGCNIKNFTNGVFFSNTSTSIVSVGNNFKGCTNKYASTPAYLVEAGNAI